jgi:hypothetical protein
MRLSTELFHFAKRCTNPDNYLLNSLLVAVSSLSIYTASRQLFGAPDIIRTRDQRNDTLCENSELIVNGKNYMNGILGKIATITKEKI